MVNPARGEGTASTSLQNRATPEKRALRRYPVIVPAVIRWKDTEDHEVSGVIRDVNDGGIFFYAKANISLGAQVELTFTVPREHTAPETFRFIGTLQRTEDSGGSEKGFAVAVSRSELMNQRLASQPLEALQAGKIDVPVMEAAGEEQPATQPSQHSRRKRRNAIVAMALAVSALVLAFAARSIMAAQEAAQSRASAAQNVQVWIDPSSGLYHCPGTAWYGKTAGGKYVKQKQAQLDGFHPAYQRACEVPLSRGNPAN